MPKHKENLVECVYALIKSVDNERFEGMYYDGVPGFDITPALKFLFDQAVERQDEYAIVTVHKLLEEAWDDAE